MTETSSHPYDALTPDTILDALEDAGFVVSGRLFALNSYENRVYQVGIEDAQPIIWAVAGTFCLPYFSSGAGRRPTPA